MDKNKPLIGITHGDINGVGYEVILKSLIDNRVYEHFTPVIYGSSKVAAYFRKVLNLQAVNINIINSATEAAPKRINIVNCITEELKVEMGKSTRDAGKSAFMSLKSAVVDLKKGLIRMLVTAPINRHNIPSGTFMGHAAYFQKEFPYQEHPPLTMFVNNHTRIALVTGDIPLKEVAARLTKEMVIKKITLLNETLKNDFTIIRPRIAVLCLNPHILPDKTNEESAIIQPAIRYAVEQGIVCAGPYIANELFAAEHFRDFDAILAMYYEQGAIAFKALSMENGAKFTAGLPFVHTSPVHGVAYELAGKRQISEESFRNALYTSIDIYNNRKQNEQLHENVLIPDRKVPLNNDTDDDILDNDDLTMTD
ncbi:MAG: 4-hydroxythreonine-4-phosphate dehydrogenase PdxA [Prevotellaceae bacterium]|jgi:4-hydroxythreonine-4-phosphate dehydrogenase|nr:4-hydroxythreonine-4-phosphate dehydrogenase PdxA [Prevotellaceae bacterium]